MVIDRYNSQFCGAAAFRPLHAAAGKAPAQAPPGKAFPDAQHFLTALDSSGGFTFQTFDDKAERKKPALSRVLHCQRLEEISGLLSRMNDAGAGVFVTVNRTDGRGRLISNVIALRAFFCDFDGVTMPSRWHLEPSAIVRRDTEHFHTYWFLKPGAPLSAFTDGQKRLARYYGSDPKIHDGPRVMRLPGFYHRKGAPILVRLESLTGCRYTLNEILTGIPDIPVVPVLQVPKPLAFTVRGEPTPATFAARYLAKVPGAVSGQAGHDRTFAVACILVHGFLLDHADAWALLCDYNARCSPPWSEKELHHKITDARKPRAHRHPAGYLLAEARRRWCARRNPIRIFGLPERAV